MSTDSREPISPQWPLRPQSPPHEVHHPARWISEQLSRLAVDAIPSQLVPLLASAAAELAQQSGIEWRVGTDELTTSLVRTISRVAIARPELGGPHVARLGTALGDAMTTQDGH